jgi:coenzyme F420-reducing hydrogenase alpha subunit
MSPAKRQSIVVETLARVEGEGGLRVQLQNGQVKDVEFRIFEPPRFFEGFLVGRDCREAPDITARICGICPVAYQMSSVHALEHGFGVQVGDAIRTLRRLLYCGEWIESHALHAFLLHAPDFLGYQDAIRMAADHRDVVERALQIKKAGNDIVHLLGGREVHPVNVRVGGFYRIPPRRAWAPLVEQLKWARDAARETVLWAGKLRFPDFTQDYEFVALRHPTEYPMCEGRLVSNRGLDIDVAGYETAFREEQAPYSTALQGMRVATGIYLVGPLARYSLNYDRLTPLAQATAREAGLGPVCTNPFQSIVVRCVETLYALEEALRILEDYPEPDAPAVPVTPHAATGYGCTEAPRGILYHRYEVDARGAIVSARIVPPTAQNQRTIEQDLRQFVPPRMHLSKEELTWQCEQVVRNYDPCISCSTHFLKVEFV